LVVCILATLAEIASCFAFRVWLRLAREALWHAPSIARLCLFA
jgi:drug/metabolite transporter superfamily protein YnfA